MRSILSLLLLLLLLPAACPGMADEVELVDIPEEEWTAPPLQPLPTEPPYTFTDVTRKTTYDSPTLHYDIDTALVNGTKCYLTTIWMQDPARQIRKATSPWHVRIEDAKVIARRIPKAALVINGSGYVSPIYPDIPENYPGESADYYYEPLGSITITDGELFRCLTGVPYYGLTLEEDGLHMYVGEDNETVLSHSPSQTWSFYEGCPLAVGGVSILDRSWPFANVRAIRTIIARLDSHTCLILTATHQKGLTLLEATDFLLGEYDAEWIYNLDGGPSSALIRRLHGRSAQTLIYGAKQKIVDVMAFVELED